MPKVSSTEKKRSEAKGYNFLSLVVSTTKNYSKRTFISNSDCIRPTDNLMLVIIIPKGCNKKKNFEHIWRRKSRGVKRRLLKGLELAVKYGFEWYLPTKNIKPYEKDLPKIAYVKNTCNPKNILFHGAVA